MSSFDDATHKRLDAEVIAAMSRTANAFGFNDSDFPRSLLSETLLTEIIERSEDSMSRHKVPHQQLFSEHKGLKEQLLDAWEKKSFREIRKLGASATHWL